MTQLLGAVGCRLCAAALEPSPSQDAAVCANGHVFSIENRLLAYADLSELAAIPEVGVRDRQAPGYLAHRKFPTQVARLSKWIAALPEHTRALPALDLGCGPGPTTEMLVDAGYSVMAVDFSRASLELNAASLGTRVAHALFVQADLNNFAITPNSTDVLVMADFLQHLGDAERQRAFLRCAVAALRPGGQFYLSFFNTNLKNRLKSDLVGSFASGAIRYRRLSLAEVSRMLPVDVRITKRYAMNIFHDAQRDRIAAALPFAPLLGRMGAIEGIKTP